MAAGDEHAGNDHKLTERPNGALRLTESQLLFVALLSLAAKHFP
ncbi:hypothetical protein AALB_0299 [Agarivorans albus MKT 106]|uniref:Uncharacterized protein n=1 Tax=Agarivorans albus MKT 106 TaxID=1331007 RepID=R9PFR7_AGAAL|nr:hypothetical protein AALB_0299 [Agarivorans albus MKT 106]